MLVYALVTCNSLLFGIPHYNIQRLQRVLNAAAARVVCLVPEDSHITRQHWRNCTGYLEISYYVKMLLLVFNVQLGIAPVYLMSLLKSKPASCYGPRNQDNLLQISNTKYKTFGDRAFLKAGPTLWYNLPLSIKNHTNIETFKTELKTHLFRLAFCN